MTDQFLTTVTINSEPLKVWTVLTNPELMTKWMGESEMKAEVHTDWKINSPIFIRGFHHVKFENKGIVLQYDKGKMLSYSHLSSVSRLPDRFGFCEPGGSGVRDHGTPPRSSPGLGAGGRRDLDP